MDAVGPVALPYPTTVSVSRPRFGHGHASLPLIVTAIAGIWFGGLLTQPVRPAAAYLGYVVVVVAVPGVIGWRLLTGGSGWRFADLVLGTGFGLALSMPTYLIGRAVGVPVLPIVLPLIAAVISIRRRDRGPRSDRSLPRAVLAAAFAGPALLIAWYARVGAQYLPISGPLVRHPNTDTPYHLAVLGEIVNHFPARVPYVANEPLRYHWMAYAHSASAHWLTGVELDRLLSVLAPFLMLLLTVTGVAATALVLSGKPAAAVTGGLVTVLAGDFGPWSWTDASGFLTDTPVAFPAMASPTQSMANVLVLLLAVATVLLYRKRAAGSSTAGCWVVVGVLMLVLSATKATVLPVYAAGVAAVVGVRLLRARRLDPTGIALGVMILLAYLAAFFVVFGGASFGMAPGLGASYRQLLDRLLGVRLAEAGGVAVVVLTVVLLVVGWLLPALAVLLLRGTDARSDPGLTLCLGALAGGIAGYSVVSHWSSSQLFLIRTATIFGLVLLGWGLAAIPREWLRYAVPALIAGAVVVLGVRQLGSGTPRQCSDPGCAITRLSVPPALALVAALLVALLVVLVLRCPPAARLTVVVCTLIGLTLAPPIGQFGSPKPIASVAASIPAGGIQAARYIRSHSGPDDVVATNVHCMLPRRPPRCLTTSFWIAGYAERRVLVEGWAYTAQANASPDQKAGLSGEFWDRGLLAANDVVFSRPTQRDLAVLRDTYGVRWLIADTRLATPPKALARLADLRLATGQTRVYELR